jgi:predicted GTPase
MPDSLERYAAARDDIGGLLDELRDVLAEVARWHGAADDLDALGATADRLRNGRFVLAVVGEFSSGKSFLLNALLGKIALEERAGARRITGLLATDINPSTATITELAYASEESATAYYANGREERIPLDGLSRFVSVGDEKLHDATGEESGTPTLVRVGVDSAFLANGFVVADTPGLASINPAHRRATLGYLPGADAVLYLIDTQQPFTDGDASFLGIVRRYIESIFIVQTKIDLWRMVEGEREAWQSAAARIVAQAAIHAPGTPVFPLSAREFAEGALTANDALIAQSRFADFRAALDASLVATTGRSRLRRASAEARRIATRAADTLALDASALETPPGVLTADRAALEPYLAAADAAGVAGSRALEATAEELRSALGDLGDAMRATLHRALGRAFDTADIARLRDRAKLHILVDETLASAMGRFASDAADLTAKRLRAGAREAVAPVVAGAPGSDPQGRLARVLAAIAGERLPITEDTARAFGADPSSGAWSVDLETGLRGTIVLGALGGPSVSLVSAIAARFASKPPGGYMKRELIADMNAALYAAFDAEVAAFVDDIAQRVADVARRVAARVADLPLRIRTETTGAIDRALAIADSAERSALAGSIAERVAAAASIATRIETRSEIFARESRAERREHPDAGLPLDQESGPANATPGNARFDPATYEHGLRPERWRVAVIGAFKRGKSSLINAMAGMRVLPDEGTNVELRFPVHVRYGPEPRVYALSDDAAWDEIPAGALAEAAARTPILVETPWDLPRQLVLVHTPAFDSGFPLAEEIVGAAAAGASEMLALFSRQLSDRELELYGRLAESGKPVTFAHTIADNETGTERRNVVMLADRYLRERAIVPQRIFTVSTRVEEAWNELGALRATLTAHAEEHMERLKRSEREREALTRLAAAPAAAPAARRPSWGWIRGRAK